MQRDYRKKPVVIQAEPWMGTTEQYERLQRDGVIKTGSLNEEDGSVIIETLEGDHKCSLNDYIIRGIKGEYYPCKPDIFEATYELVEQPELADPETTSAE